MMTTRIVVVVTTTTIIIIISPNHPKRSNPRRVCHEGRKGKDHPAVVVVVVVETIGLGPQHSPAKVVAIVVLVVHEVVM